MIRGDYSLEGLCVTKDIEEVPCNDRFFYIHRFYSDPGRRHYKSQNIWMEMESKDHWSRPIFTKSV